MLVSSGRFRPPVVIGAACVDIKGWPRAPLILHTSNIGSLARRPGGVGFNLACQLALLGCAPTFVTLIGRDPDGDYLLAQCRERGLDTSHVGRCDADTCVYVAILDEQGDLAVGLAAMDLCDEMTEETLPPLDRLVRAAPLVMVDANLPTVTLERIADLCTHYETPLWAEPATADKCRRLLPLASRLACIKPNHEELEALVGRPLPNDEDVLAGARDLQSLGVCTVLVTLGERGVLRLDEHGHCWHPSRPVPVEDVTGAGDAFLAATAWALLDGRPLGQAVDIGIASALLTLQRTDSVPHDLCAQDVLDYHQSLEKETSP